MIARTSTPDAVRRDMLHFSKIIINQVLPLKHAAFSQRYKDGDNEVKCWWGISGDSMSFLVIDATSGPNTDASFNLTTGDNDSHGILECADGIRCIDMTGTVVYLTEDCVGGARLPMSTSQLTTYLGGGKYPLSLAGIKTYLRECDT